MDCGDNGDGCKGCPERGPGAIVPAGGADDGKRNHLLAVGRRLRRTYAGILAVQAAACYGRIAIHPEAEAGLGDFPDRATILLPRTEHGGRVEPRSLIAIA